MGLNLAILVSNLSNFTFLNFQPNFLASSFGCILFLELKR